MGMGSTSLFKGTFDALQNVPCPGFGYTFVFDVHCYICYITVTSRSRSGHATNFEEIRTKMALAISHLLNNLMGRAVDHCTLLILLHLIFPESRPNYSHYSHCSHFTDGEETNN
jgi:hypothetical protein